MDGTQVAWQGETGLSWQGDGGYCIPPFDIRPAFDGRFVAWDNSWSQTPNPRSVFVADVGDPTQKVMVYEYRLGSDRYGRPHSWTLDAGYLVEFQSFSDPVNGKIALTNLSTNQAKLLDFGPKGLFASGGRVGFTVEESVPRRVSAYDLRREEWLFQRVELSGSAATAPVRVKAASNDWLVATANPNAANETWWMLRTSDGAVFGDLVPERPANAQDVPLSRISVSQLNSQRMTLQVSRDPGATWQAQPQWDVRLPDLRLIPQATSQTPDGMVARLVLGTDTSSTTSPPGDDPANTGDSTPTSQGSGRSGVPAWIVILAMTAAVAVVINRARGGKT